MSFDVSCCNCDRKLDPNGVCGWCCGAEAMPGRCVLSAGHEGEHLAPVPARPDLLTSVAYVLGAMGSVFASVLVRPVGKEIGFDLTKLSGMLFGLDGKSPEPTNKDDLDRVLSIIDAIREEGTPIGALLQAAPDRVTCVDWAFVLGVTGQVLESSGRSADAVSRWQIAALVVGGAGMTGLAAAALEVSRRAENA